MRMWKRWPRTSLFLTLFACAHEAAPLPEAPLPVPPAEQPSSKKNSAASPKAPAESDQRNCKEIPRDPKSYIVRLLDEKAEELNNPDLLVDIEKRYDFFHADP